MAGDQDGGYHGAGSAGSPGLAVIVPTTTSPLLNGLLSGVKWAVGPGHQITYAYPSSAADYAYNGEPGTFQQVSVTQFNTFEYAIRLVEDYTQLDFVGGANGSANIRFATFTEAGGRPHAYYPTGSTGMGDVWMGNLNSGVPGHGLITNPTPGGFSFATHLHEFGHALGLKHGHERGINNSTTAATTQDGRTIPNNAPLPAAYDNWNWTIMSYRSHTGASPGPVQGVMQSDNPVTFMPLDILALQYMYGAEYTGASSGNGTVYHWDTNGFFSRDGVVQVQASNGKMLMTVWDGGGTGDVYDFSSFTTNQRISLVPGEFSTFNAAQLADLSRFKAGLQPALGNVANAFLFGGNTASLIEIAVAGTGNDILKGNQANNELYGNSGNDNLTGGAGLDLLNGGPGNDVYNLGNKADSLTTISDASGADTIVSTIDRSLVNRPSVEGLNLAAGIRGTGNESPNSIIGNAGNNVLAGRGGNDAIAGGGAQDTIFGQGGADRLNGGAGNDMFVFQVAADSSVSMRDVILDFDRFGDDRINLQSVYGPALKFLTTPNAAFTGVGQVRVVDNAATGPNIFIDVNLSGNAAPEMRIILANSSAAIISANDFLL